MLISTHLIHGIETRFESFNSLADFAMYVLRNGYSLEHSLVALDLDGTLIESDNKGETRLLDSDTAQIIKAMKDAGCKVIALTARCPEKAEITFKQLQEVGINFVDNQNLVHPFEYQFFRKGQLQRCKFENNILFVGRNEKGKALFGFDSIMKTRHEGWLILNFFFLDNNRIWVERFKQRFELLDAPEHFVLAGHFNPTKNQPKPLFEETRRKTMQAIEALWAWFG